jgi:hypothetical protein
MHQPAQNVPEVVASRGKLALAMLLFEMKNSPIQSKACPAFKLVRVAWKSFLINKIWELGRQHTNSGFCLQEAVDAIVEATRHDPPTLEFVNFEYISFIIMNEQFQQSTFVVTNVSESTTLNALFEITVNIAP